MINVTQVHCHLHLQHIQRNNRICHHPLNAHAQVNKHMSACLTIDYFADRKRVRRVIIVYLLGKDTRQQLRSLPHFALNTVIMRDIVTSWQNTRTACPSCSTTRGSWTWCPSPASPPSSSSSTSTTGSSPTTPLPPPVAWDRKLKARLKKLW